MRVLDLYCGAGGSARGYQMAGFDVTGVDVVSQPFYAGNRFYMHDALDFCQKEGKSYDVIHASPPCQRYSESTPMSHRLSHPDVIRQCREVLQATGVPYVIENVENARWRLHRPVMLCGTMFGLGVWRHRYFEVWPYVIQPPGPCRHSGPPVVINAGSHSRKTQNRSTVVEVGQAMGIDWMSLRELSQAIPPAYTDYLGRHILRLLRP